MKSSLCLSLLGFALLSGCGVTKELLPARPDSALPDFPVKEKAVEPPDTHVVKREELQISHVNDPIQMNAVTLATGAEKYARIQKQFRLPIQFDGWLKLTQVEQSFDKCSGKVLAPVFLLTNDLNQTVELTLDQKVQVEHEKLYVVKVVFQNDALCTGLNIQFGVLFGE